MELKKQAVSGKGVKIIIEEEGQPIGRGFLYVLTNDLHSAPFGFIEDVFVDETFRGRGFGEKIVTALIEEAKKNKCYKLICTSRFSNERAHHLYEKLGFKKHGNEFRMDF
ncbi:MAG TPA: GNAT family N-acetyltransferase [Candidatus Nanoarchaeia archaeon]|nr:GNAT family N-acetyltransferase [Candidatus Nanoarchaeia archaeon]